MGDIYRGLELKARDINGSAGELVVIRRLHVVGSRPSTPRTVTCPATSCSRQSEQNAYLLTRRYHSCDLVTV